MVTYSRKNWKKVHSKTAILASSFMLNLILTLSYQITRYEPSKNVHYSNQFTAPTPLHEYPKKKKSLRNVFLFLCIIYKRRNIRVMRNH